MAAVGVVRAAYRCACPHVPPELKSQDTSSCKTMGWYVEFWAHGRVFEPGGCTALVGLSNGTDLRPVPPTHSMPEAGEPVHAANTDYH